MKKILVVDDSALMRRVLCDIINTDSRFEVADTANDGIQAFDLLSRNQYDAVVLDVNMPKMNGLELLKELQKFKIPAKVMMASTDTKEGAKTTLDALELGALDFIHKPENALDCRGDEFKEQLLRTLGIVTSGKAPAFKKPKKIESSVVTKQMVKIVQKHASVIEGSKIIAIASSTGGPKALQSVIPRLPKNLNAPVLLVQHMPAGFTASLAERLNSLSEIEVREAKEGDIIKSGCVYLSKGGFHMTVESNASGKATIHYTQEPAREGVRPCANYMYESLMDSVYDRVVCVVMTGMGADGTEGIEHLKTRKKVHVIAQNQDSCAVYGMPRSIVKAELADNVVALEQIAQEVILNTGVM